MRAFPSRFVQFLPWREDHVVDGVFHSIFIIQGQVALTVFPQNVGAIWYVFMS
jgi:hypothetical protein